MSNTIEIEVSFYIETCCNCGVAFGMPVEMQKRLKREGGNFYCPNGHPQHYTETDESKLRKALADEKRRHSQTQMELLVVEKKVESVQKAKKRLEKRIKNGVCPCCNRQVVQLTRHMHTQHPEYQEESENV